MTEEKIIKLITLYCQNDINKTELKELKSWIYESEANRTTFKRLQETYKDARKIGFSKSINTDEAWKNISSHVSSSKSSRKSIGRKFLYYAASVVMLVSLGITGTLLTTDIFDNDGNMVAEIMPGGKKATLTLSDGSRINLTESQPKKISEQNGAEININEESNIVYSPKENKSKKLIYNTVSVPRAGEYILKLSDGTKVWLNSESEIRYPVAFNGSLREVFIKGEVFFKVAKDKKKPFIVNCYNTKVKVLGTVFNVNAYNNGSKIYTTLVEGSVSVGKEKSVIIKPGQQAVTEWNSQDVSVKDVDVNLYTSWVEGIFEYEGMRLEYIAEQLKRWYDIDFVFEDDELKDKKFTGVISRHKPLNFILNLMEQLSDVKYTIKNKKTVIIHKK